MKAEIKDELTNLAKQISETFSTFRALDDECIFGAEQVELIVREKLDSMIDRIEQVESSELKYVSFNELESNESAESNESDSRLKLIDLDWQKLEEKMKEANRDYKIQVTFSLKLN